MVIRYIDSFILNSQHRLPCSLNILMRVCYAKGEIRGASPTYQSDIFTTEDVCVFNRFHRPRHRPTLHIRNTNRACEMPTTDNIREYVAPIITCHVITSRMNEADNMTTYFNNIL